MKSVVVVSIVVLALLLLLGAPDVIDVVIESTPPSFRPTSEGYYPTVTPIPVYPYP